MSGICGQFNLDNVPVAEIDIRAMTAMLQRRGPDRTGRWRDSSVGLGHTLLATTQELVFERQPVEHAGTGCVITADVRLDNREELLGALNLSERLESIGDAELILLAYLTWGEQCPDRLLGDFAFAIWDPRHQLLFCARDHFGLRPLYYHHMQGRHFLFASDARAILVVPQVPYRINQGRVADFLVQELEWIDYTSTFFEGIFRLPPGNKLTASAAGLEIVEYWKPVPGPELNFTSDQDYEQGFLEVFTRAVGSRLRAPPGIAGSMLSGGMDSGSVVAVAKEILKARGEDSLRTFSAARDPLSDDTDCAESRAIYAAASMPSISPTLIHPDDLRQDAEALVAGNEEPFDGEWMFLKSIYRAAHSQGVRVVFDGGGGDVVLAEGSYILRLLRNGQFRLAISEIAAEKVYWESGSSTSNLLRYMRSFIVPEAVKKRLRGPRHRHGVRKILESTLISRDFAASVDIENRFEQMRQIFPGEPASDYAVESCNVIRPNLTAGRERYGRIAATCGVQACDPFLDKRVVDYCSRLPGMFRLQGGWPKMILRNLMAGKLPDEVRWTRGKPHIGWVFGDAVGEHQFDRGMLNIDQLQTDLETYVDASALTTAWRKFRDGEDTEPILAVYILSIWLQEHKSRPVAPK